MVIADGSSILFTGDSITDAGRMRPVGEDAKDWLGTGYVSMIASILEAWQPGHRYRIRNTGISGNTVLDLQARWGEDVLSLRPDWLSIMVGINDCARAFARPRLTETHVPPNVFRTTLEALVGATRPLVKGLVIMTPFYVDSNLHDALRVALGSYAAAAREVADMHDCVLVDTQAAFDVAMARTHALRLSDDRVHPRPTGHMILAKAWLEAVGFGWQPAGGGSMV
jgi:lysophospholipase L1-like esterase